jgi:hypothetical protein
VVSGRAAETSQTTQISTEAKLAVHSRLAIAGFVAGGIALCAAWTIGAVHGQVAVRNQGFVPYYDEPIHYLSDDLNDPIARLQKRLDAGHAHLDWESKGGYLRSLLAILRIPISSQTLVFSKTSFQYKKISPQTPRALYFNDDVYVGFVKDGKALEVVSFDPVQGGIFYLLDVQKEGHPVFKRAELDCTQCHITASTRGIPGVLLRSVYPTPTGTQASLSHSYVTGQDSPLKQRWGGWYVTGTCGRQAHMGNAVVQDSEHPEVLDTATGANITSLAGRFDTTAYLSDQSDIVAHLVLGHQTQMHNLITLTNYQTRIAIYNEKKKGITGEAAANEVRQTYQQPAEDLLRYLLFTNEAPLDDAVHGNSGFERDFEALGPRDRKGRSLRDFELRTRIFRYPCSYLIYSEDWDSLPDPSKDYLYHRLYEVLTGQDNSRDFVRLHKEDRKAILEILLDTKPNLPPEWHQTHRQELRAKALFGRTRSALQSNRPT